LLSRGLVIADPDVYSGFNPDHERNQAHGTFRDIHNSAFFQLNGVIFMLFAKNVHTGKTVVVF